MKKKARNLKRKVFFNASVILAGLKSPKGGSAKLLKWVKQRKIQAFVSEIVIDEVERNLSKLNLKKREFEKTRGHFQILPSPPYLSEKYFKIAKDKGDIHLFTSAQMIGAEFLVSLDKRHVLSLANKIKDFKIFSPGELIEKISL